MFPMRIGGGYGVLIGVDGGVRLEGGVGSLLVETSIACNLALLYEVDLVPMQATTLINQS
jgi:hypothetical protein